MLPLNEQHFLSLIGMSAEAELPLSCSLFEGVTQKPLPVLSVHRAAVLLFLVMGYSVEMAGFTWREIWVAALTIKWEGPLVVPLSLNRTWSLESHTQMLSPCRPAVCLVRRVCGGLG